MAGYDDLKGSNTALSKAATFAKDDLTFVKEPPDSIVIECSICFEVMLTEPHLVSCCGRHFCGSCLGRVKAANGACPMCRSTSYQSFIDKDRLRIINGLQVYCTNSKSGCQWKGELKGLSTHLNRGKRNGECQFEVVHCRHKPILKWWTFWKANSNQHCDTLAQRVHLLRHETKECPNRPYKCQYCGYGSTFYIITESHYMKCSKYPVPCPNGCELKGLPRDTVTTHCATDCPLQPVQCEFSWADCSEKVLRKDLIQHASDNHLKHTSLLAKACRELKKENEAVKRECEELKSVLRQKGFIKT